MMQTRTVVVDRQDPALSTLAIGAARALPGPRAAAAATPAFDSAAALAELRRLRYFRDLLLQGFESTVWPDRPRRTLRDERQALGIDHPELDAVALWSSRCGDGMVAIPFIEYILRRVKQSAGRFAPFDHDGEIAAALDRLEEDRTVISPSGDPVPALPRLGDVYVPEAVIARLCGFGGILDQVVDCCRSVMLRQEALATVR